MRSRAFPLSVAVAAVIAGGAMTQSAQAQSFPRLEASFSLPALTSDPFDYDKTDVEVQIRKPDRTVVSVPAFFDGGTTWRVRFTPQATGTYQLGAITLNGQPSGATGIVQQPWRVSGAAQPGFVRVDKRNPRRFAFENGTRFFPVGHDVAWKNPGDPTIPAMFDAMGAAGENWSRVWMNHWDDKNLDWPSQYTTVKFGELNLDVARKWDGIVDAAAKDGIFFQMTLQHHGQISTRTDPNWQDNPYNAARGGFLKTPQEFFTDAQAKALTKRKLRYIVARYGYSPNIMAWELFNEVQFADASRDGQWDNVAAWHDEMAAFLRAQDVNHHLVTTSSEIPVSVYRTLDYFQHHDYPQDIIAAGRNPQNLEAQAIAKPNFGGEAGMGTVQPYGMHAVLWSSLMSNQSGTSEPWFWDVIARENLYSTFTPVQNFVKLTKLADRDNLKKIDPTATSSTLADLVISPARRGGGGGGGGNNNSYDFTVGSDSNPASFAGLSGFFPGVNTDVPARRGGPNNPAPAAPPAGAAPAKMTPHPLVFKVNYAQPNRMTLNLGRVSANGAHIKVSVDDKVVADQDLAASPAPAPGAGGGGGFGGGNIVSASIPVEIPAGPHSITLENTGQDGVQIRDLTFANTLAALAVYGVEDENGAALWIYHRGQVLSANAPQSVTGQVAVAGLAPGTYRAVWFDTTMGQTIRTDAVRATGAAVVLSTPPITRDVAVSIQK